MKKTAFLATVLIGMVSVWGCGEDKKDEYCGESYAYSYFCEDGKMFTCDNGKSKELSEFPVINGVGFSCDSSEQNHVVWRPVLTNQCDADRVIGVDDDKRYTHLCDANGYQVKCYSNSVSQNQGECQNCDVNTFEPVCDNGWVSYCGGRMGVSTIEGYERGKAKYSCKRYVEPEPFNACDGDFVVGIDDKRYTSICGLRGTITCKDGRNADVVGWTLAEDAVSCAKDEVAKCDAKTFGVSCQELIRPVWSFMNGSTHNLYLAVCDEGEVVYNETPEFGERYTYNGVRYVCRNIAGKPIINNTCKDGKIQKGVDGEYVDSLCGAKGKVVCEAGSSRATETDEPCE